MYTYKINTKIFTNKQKDEKIHKGCFAETQKDKMSENESLYHKFVGTYLYLKPFLFINNNKLSILSEGFSPLEKNALICSLGAILPIQSGVAALCR